MVFTRNTPSLTSPAVSPGRPESIPELNEMEVEAALSARRPRTATSDSIASGSKKKPRLSTSTATAIPLDKGKGRATASGQIEADTLPASTSTAGFAPASGWGSPHYSNAALQPKPGPVSASTPALPTNPTAPVQSSTTGGGARTIPSPASVATGSGAPAMAFGTAAGSGTPTIPTPSASAGSTPLIPISIAPAQIPSAGGATSASGTTANTTGNTAMAAVGTTAAEPTPGPSDSSPAMTAREASLVEQTINRMLLAVNPAGTTMLATNTAASREFLCPSFFLFVSFFGVGIHPLLSCHLLVGS